MNRCLLRKYGVRRFCDKALRFSEDHLIRLQQCFQKGLHEGVISAYENLITSEEPIDRPSLMMVLHGYARSASSLDPETIMEHSKLSGISFDKELFVDLFTVCILKDNHRGVQTVLDCWSQSFATNDFPFSSVLNLLVSRYGMQHHVVQNALFKLTANMVKPEKIFTSHHLASRQNSLQSSIRELEASLQHGFINIALKRFNDIENASSHRNLGFGNISETPEWAYQLSHYDILNPNPNTNLPQRLQKLQIELNSPQLHRIIREIKPKENRIIVLQRALEYFDQFNIIPDEKAWNRFILIFVRCKGVVEHPDLLLNFIRKYGHQQVLHMYYNRVMKELLPFNSMVAKKVAYERLLPCLLYFTPEEIEILTNKDRQIVTVTTDHFDFFKHPNSHTAIITKVHDEDCGLKTGNKFSHFDVVNSTASPIQLKLNDHHKNIREALTGGEKSRMVNLHIETSDLTRLLDGAPFMSGPLFEVCLKFKTDLTVSNYHHFVKYSRRNNDTESLLKILSYGATRNLHPKDPSVWLSILDSLLMAPSKSDPSFWHKAVDFNSINLPENNRHQIPCLLTRWGASLDDIAQHASPEVLPFLSLLSIFKQSKAENSDFDPSIILRHCTNMEHLSSSIENFLGVLSLSMECKYILQLLDFMDQEEIVPTPRMREMISSLPESIQKQEILKKYFIIMSTVKSSESSLLKHWLHHKELKEAIFWLKRQENSSEEDRLNCLFALAKNLKYINEKEMRHFIRLKNEEDQDSNEIFLPKHAWETKSNAFVLPPAIVDAECDVTLKNTERGWKIWGIPSERERAVEIMRTQFENNNLMTSLPHGLAYLSRLQRMGEKFDFEFGGVNGSDEIHIWGNPFMRGQKIRSLINDLEKNRTMIEMTCDASYIQRIRSDDFPFASVENTTGAQLIFPEGNTGKLYILGTEEQKHNALDILFALNPPQNTERATALLTSTSHFNKRHGPNASVLDLQWISKRMETDDGKRFANIVSDISSNNSYDNGDFVYLLSDKSSLSFEMKREIFICAVEMLLARGEVPQALKILENNKFLSATDWQNILQKVFISIGGFVNSQKNDCLQIALDLPILIEKLEKKFPDENILTTNGISELLYNGYMQANLRMCQSALDLGYQYIPEGDFPDPAVFKWMAIAQLKVATECTYFLDDDLHPNKGIDMPFGVSFLKLCRKCDSHSLAHFLQDFINKISIDRLLVGLSKEGNVDSLQFLLSKLEWIDQISSITQLDRSVKELLGYKHRQQNVIEKNKIDECCLKIIQFMEEHSNQLTDETFMSLMDSFSVTNYREGLLNISEKVLRRGASTELLDVCRLWKERQTLYR